MKTISFALLAAISFPSVAAARPFEADSAKAMPSASLRARRVAAAAATALKISPTKRMLQDAAPLCYTVNDAGDVNPISCDRIGTCFNLVCCDDEVVCFGSGVACQGALGFELVNADQPGCPWQYSCCY